MIFLITYCIATTILLFLQRKMITNLLNEWALALSRTEEVLDLNDASLSREENFLKQLKEADKVNIDLLDVIKKLLGPHYKAATNAQKEDKPLKDLN